MHFRPFPAGSRICLLGDSITAQNKYLTWIADGYKIAFPDADIRFFNCACSDGTTTLEEKMAFVEKYLTDKKWDVSGRRPSLNAFFKKIAENYLEYKPVGNALSDRIEKLYIRLTADHPNPSV